jgi:hypothetical protein
MSDYKTIPTSVIPALTSVRLYGETVEKVRVDHPEVPVLLPCVMTAIERTIENPTHVEKSYNNSYVFQDADSQNKSGDPLRVAVKIIDGTSGRVKSFYFASPNQSIVPIYRRPSDVE